MGKGRRGRRGEKWSQWDEILMGVGKESPVRNKVVHTKAKHYRNTEAEKRKKVQKVRGDADLTPTDRLTVTKKKDMSKWMWHLRTRERSRCDVKKSRNARRGGLA